MHSAHHLIAPSSRAVQRHSVSRTILPMMAASLCILGTITSSGQFEFRLNALTVPPAELPGGCRLKPVPPPQAGQPRFVMWPGVHENPWIAPDPGPGAVIRDRIEGEVVPSDWPNTPADYRISLRKGFRETYRAVYLSTDTSKRASEVDVSAILYDDPKLAARATLAPLVPGQAPRIVRGAMAALVSGPNGDCFRAVARHISRLRG
jgi:hypothetical protein